MPGPLRGWRSKIQSPHQQRTDETYHLHLFHYYSCMQHSTNPIWHIIFFHNIYIYISHIFASFFSHHHYFILALNIIILSYYSMHAFTNHILLIKFSHNIHKNISNISASLLFSHTHSFILASHINYFILLFHASHNQSHFTPQIFTQHTYKYFKYFCFFTFFSHSLFHSCILH
jgi:hypothetical protein